MPLNSIGYASGQLPASQLAGIVGAKWMFGLSILIPAILSILTPTVILSSFEASLFVRAMLGLSASGT
jgi:MFS family permease